MKWIKKKYKDFIKSQFYKYWYIETYQYFEEQSANHPRWWTFKAWWKDTPRQANPIYINKHPKESFWHL